TGRGRLARVLGRRRDLGGTVVCGHAHRRLPGGGRGRGGADGISRLLVGLVGERVSCHLLQARSRRVRGQGTLPAEGPARLPAVTSRSSSSRRPPVNATNAGWRLSGWSGR